MGPAEWCHVRQEMIGGINARGSALSRESGRAVLWLGSMRYSGGGGRDLPLLSGRRAEEPQRPSGDQMALEIERVVDGGMGDRKRWVDPGDLNRCIFRSRRRTT